MSCSRYFQFFKASSPTTGIQLSYRDDLHLLAGRWLMDATPEEFRVEYEAVLAAARRHKAWNGLLDVRRRPLPPAGAVERLNQVVMPQASAAASQPLCVAYLVLPQRRQAIAAHERRQTAAIILEPGQPRAQVRLYGDEGAATRWLTGQPG